MSGGSIKVECETCGYKWTHRVGTTTPITFPSGLDAPRARYFCSAECFDARHGRPLHEGPLPWMPPEDLGSPEPIRRPVNDGGGTNSEFGPWG